MNLKFHRPPVSVNDHSRKGPLFPDIGVLALVPEKWGGPWQPRHYVLTRLAAYFNVVWVGPAQGWREAWLGRTTEVSEKDLNNDLPPQALTLYQPSIWLPKFYRPTVLDSITTRRRLQQARNILLRQGCRRIVLYLWRPEFESALDMIPHDVSCYHIDDEYSFSPVSE